MAVKRISPVNAGEWGSYLLWTDWRTDRQTDRTTDKECFQSRARDQKKLKTARQQLAASFCRVFVLLLCSAALHCRFSSLALSVYPFIDNCSDLIILLHIHRHRRQHIIPLPIHHKSLGRFVMRSALATRKTALNSFLGKLWWCPWLIYIWSEVTGDFSCWIWTI